MMDLNLIPSESQNTTRTTPSLTLSTTVSGQKRPATTWLPAKRKPRAKRIKSSWIYRHEKAVQKEGDSAIYWKCGLCAQPPYKANTTTSSEYHLQKINFISEQDAPTEALSVFEQQQRAAERGKSTTSFLETLIRWTVVCHVPFNMVVFRRLLLHSESPSANELLPKSHHTIKKAILDEFARGKSHLRNLLKTAKSDISLSFDLWSSLPTALRSTASLHTSLTVPTSYKRYCWV